jgi:dTDP-4-dehydrorhamnose 3,5-epimerase
VTERFSVQETPLEGLLLLRRRAISDERGSFERLYDATDLAGVLGDRSIAQVNRSVTAKAGTVRGIHLQRTPYAEMKLVTCVRGTVFDVAVDVRPDSPTFLQWHAERLTGNDPATFVLPEGFAHGFQAISDDCELIYLHTAPFVPEAADGLNPSDPHLGIDWPLPVAIISERDGKWPIWSQRRTSAGQ